jgi:hypothetical protein
MSKRNNVGTRMSDARSCTTIKEPYGWSRKKIRIEKPLSKGKKPEN